MKKILLILTLMLAVPAVAQNLAFPDPWLKSVLLSANASNNIAFSNNMSVKIDTNSDFEISVAEAALIDRIWLENDMITNVQGIAQFPNLTQLGFKGLAVTTISLGGLAQLDRITILENPDLTSVSISNLGILDQIACMDNPLLESAMATNCPQLTTFWMTGNGLTSVDVSGLPSLERLYCDNNQIAALDVSGLLNLQEILVRNNQLTAIDASNLPDLIALYADNNPNLTAVNASNCPSFLPTNGISFDDCPNLASVDLSGCTSLSHIFFQGYLNLASLDVSNCTGLTNLSVNGSALTNLDVTGCSLLNQLICNENELTSLDLTGCTSLSTLVAHHNSLADINFTGCFELFSVNLTNNALLSIDLANRPLLQFIELQENVFLAHVDLHNCPELGMLFIGESDVNYLDVSNCTSLSDLEVGGAAYETLNVQGCVNLDYLAVSGHPADVAPITSLDLSNLPALTTVGVGHMDLQTIDFTGSNNVQSVMLTGLPMASIELPASVTSIGLDAMNLETLDLSAMTGFDTLSLWNDNSSLTAIFAKNGATETMFLNGNLSGLEFICQDESAIGTTQTAINNAGLVNNVVCNSYCSFVPGGDYNTITGTLSFDLDNNGCDASDMAHPNIRIDIDNGNEQGATFTNANGVYNFYTGAGNFDLTANLENPGIFTVLPATANVVFADNNDNVTTQNFCISANGTANDVEIVIAPLIPARPGFAAWYQVAIRNKGNQTVSGSFEFTYNDAVSDFVAALPAQASQTSGLVTWNYTDLLPFENRSALVQLQVNAPTDTPAVNLGDILSFTATINPIAGDILPVDNQFTFNQTVVGSYDPNDIKCIQGDVVSPLEIGNFLHYIVNFENTGTAEAENVVVRIEVDTEKYDVSSLQLINASHANYTRVNGNVVEFIFEGINLGVAGDPPVGGHGNVLFKMRSNDTLSEGDIVVKSANIFFDYNFPIETLPAETVFQSLGNPEVDVDDTVSVYPNPARSLVNIGSQSEIKRVMLFDVQGRLLQTVLGNSTEAILDVSSRANGLYFLKITTVDEIKVEKLLKQ